MYTFFWWEGFRERDGYYHAIILIINNATVKRYFCINILRIEFASYYLKIIDLLEL